MNKLNLFWNWLVLSSKDPEKLSLTLKAGIAYAIATVAFFNVPTEGLPELGEQIVAAVEQAIRLGSVLVGVFAAFRKVKSTIGGTNAVLNDHLLR